MNKNFVETNIGRAKAAIEEMPGLLDDKKQLDKTLRSKMAAFGAAIYMSGLLTAIAYYSKNEPTVIKLLAKLYRGDENANLFDIVSKEGHINDAREKILGYAVCLKLAMNLFKLKESNDAKD